MFQESQAFCCAYRYNSVAVVSRSCRDCLLLIGCHRGNFSSSHGCCTGCCVKATNNGAQLSRDQGYQTGCGVWGTDHGA
ncbi:hypothetical protein DPMN_062157 [Dreissena polymorpha]|uniref:Uncharacterized protein n=1 Tax=Dreissena polymorpha TaxID=45954 RepID=A0A9D4C944_DREPO|nr:hypothetical protein DPMN_062157 [Dreissena polymorpha]